LFQRLDRTSDAALTWLCGPPGAGKSTLVSSYLETRAIRSLWYQVDDSDADIATLFYYLGRAAPPRRRSLPLLTPGFRPHLATFARRFFRELFGRFTSPFAIFSTTTRNCRPARHFTMCSGIWSTNCRRTDGSLSLAVPSPHRV